MAVTLTLRVMAPNRTVWSSEAQEVVLSTQNGQIGVLPSHAPLLTVLGFGIMRARVNGQWITLALMGGFAQINSNQITVLVNEAERASDIDLQEAREAFQRARDTLSRAIGRKQMLEANRVLDRARARLQAVSLG